MKLIHCEIGRKYSAGKKIKLLNTIEQCADKTIAWLYTTDSGKEYIKYNTGVIANIVPEKGINYELI